MINKILKKRLKMMIRNADTSGSVKDSDCN